MYNCSPGDVICGGDCWGDEQTCLGELGLSAYGNYTTSAYNAPTGQILFKDANPVVHVGLYDAQNVPIQNTVDIANVQIYSIDVQTFASSSNYINAPWTLLGPATPSAVSPGVWDFTVNMASISNSVVLRAALNNYSGNEIDAITVLQKAQSYTNPISGGQYNFIVNQLDHGSNTVSDSTFLQVSPNLSDPNGINNAVLYAWNGASFDAYQYWTGADAQNNFGFASGDGWYDAAGNLVNIVWNPGQGNIIYSPVSSGYLAFTGTPHVPVLPFLPSGYDSFNLIGAQTNEPGTFENITGLSPQEGDQVFQHVAGQPAIPVQAPNYTVYTFAGETWSPGVPSLAPQEAAWFYLPSLVSSCVRPPANLALWLPFDETSGSISANLAPGGNNGTQVNNPSVNLGSYVANSLCFNGANQYVTVSNYPAINPGTGDFSIDAWVLRSSGTPNSPPSIIVDKRDPNSGIGYSLSLSFGNLIFELADSTGFTNFRDTNGVVPADNKWHFIAVTVNRSSTTPGGQFYVDGVSTAAFTPDRSGSLNNAFPFQVASSLAAGGNVPWRGCIDEVEFFRRSLATAEIQGIYKAGPNGKCKHSCVPVPANVALWLPFDEPSGTLSANLAPGGNNGTHVNSPGASIGSYVGNSLSFNGANQYVTVPDYAAINPGSGDLSIDAWVRRSSAAPNSPPSIIVDKRDASSGIGYSLSLSYGNLIFQLADPSGYTNYRDTNGVVPADNKWHFVAVVVNRGNANGGQFYVDSVATSTFNPTGRPGSLNNTGAFQVGASVVGGNVPWLGGIDEVEFFHRALSLTEVQSIYTAGSNGKCKPGCVAAPASLALWLPLDETSGLVSANLVPGGNNGTKVNSPAVNIGGYVANSLCFDGFSQYITVPDYPAINPGTGDLSIDAWVKRSSASGNTVRVIVDKRDPNTTVGYSLAVSFGNLVFQLSGANYRDTGTVPADDQWHFVAVTVTRGSSVGGQFYIDGAATGTFDPTGQPGSLNNTWPFEVASSLVAGNSPWMGCLDEVEFFRRALSASEIQTIYNAGSSGKCKHSCVAVPASLSLWLPFDETAGTTSANFASPANYGTKVNGPSVISGAYVLNSLGFNGVNQHVTVPDYSAIEIGTNDLTIDAWVNRATNAPNSLPSVVLDKRDPNTGIGYSLSVSYGRLILTLSGVNYATSGATIVPPDGHWHFVAVSLKQKSGVPLGAFYIDGILVGTFAPGQTNLKNTSSLWVGGSLLGGNRPWLGGLDEIEIFGRALSTGEIQSIYDAGTFGKCKSQFTLPPNSVIFNGLLNQSLGVATASLGTNQFGTSIVALENLGSSGQDGVSVSLGHALSCSISLAPVSPLPIGGWVQADAVGSVGGVPDSPLGTLRVTHDDGSISPDVDGFQITADLSALGSPTERVEVWNNHSLVAAFPGQPAGAVARISSLPDSWGKLGPNNAGPIYGCLVVANPYPTNVWVNNIHYIGDEIRVLQESGPTVDFISGFNITSGNIDSFDVSQETMVGLPLTFDDLQNTPVGNGSIEVGADGTLALGNLGSSGQDGVSISLGRALSCSIALTPLTPIPVNGWLQADATGSLGGVTNHAVGTLRVTHVNTSANGYQVTADLSALGSSTERVEVWNNHSLVAAFPGQPSGVVALMSSLPIAWGKLGPVTGQPPYYGCLVIYNPNPTDVWVNGVHYVGDELRVLQEAGPAVDYLSAFTISAGDVGAIDIAQETSTGLSTTLGGLLNAPLGNAFVVGLGTNGTDGFYAGNLGSSGQDGVSMALGRALSCSITLVPLAPVPVGGWLQADAIGSLGGVPNSPVGTLRVTHDSTNIDGYQVTADLSALGSDTERLEVWNNHSLVAAFPAQPVGIVAQMSALPSTWGKLGPVNGQPPNYGCLVIYNPYPTNVWVNGIYYMSDELRILQEEGPSVDYLSAFNITAGNIGVLTVTQESAVLLPPPVITTTFTPGNLLIQWLGGGVLQESSDLQNWTNVDGAKSPFSVVPAAPKQFYRISQ